MKSDYSCIVDLDRLLHEPMRLLLVSLLAAVESVDYLYLLRETGMSKGNLTSHLAKLEDAGYIKVEKMFRGKIPQTIYALTPTGHQALKTYRQQLQKILALHISAKDT